MNTVDEKYIHEVTSLNARRLERASRWEEAREMRKLLGHTDDVKAIDMIIEAIEKGDRYRELTKLANEDFQRRILNISQFSEITRQAHIEVYGRPY